jgi:hypothetical protein
MYDYIHDTLAGICDHRAAIQFTSTDALPDAICTYYLVAGNPQGFFGNSPRRENERYSVQYADRDKRNLEPKAAAIRAAMEAAGFLYVNKSPDLHDDDTGHWSRTIDFRYFEEVNHG